MILVRALATTQRDKSGVLFSIKWEEEDGEGGGSGGGVDGEETD